MYIICDRDLGFKGFKSLLSVTGKAMGGGSFLWLVTDERKVLL